MRYMKNYVDACRFPLLKMGDVLVPRLVLGHLPFVGESYQGSSRNLEYTTRFSDMKNTVRILRLAVERYGVTVAAAGIGDENKLGELLFKAIRETERTTRREIAIIPCVQIPLKILGKPVDVYRRWLTYYEIEKRETDRELLSKYLEDPVLQCRSGWRPKFEEALRISKPYGRREIEALQIDRERLDASVSFLRGFNVLFFELGSETDFLAMTGRTDLLASLIGHIRERFGYRVILGVHHAGSTIPVLEESKIEFDGYVTPINRLGVMMFPTPNTALQAIRSSQKPIIAIKPLAGGRIPPRHALEYVYKELGIDSCMIGVGSESEAEEDFSTALEILKQ